MIKQTTVDLIWMELADLQQLKRHLQIKSWDIAESWYQAVAYLGEFSLPETEVRLYFASTVEKIIDLLFNDNDLATEGEAIGVSLARFYGHQPDVLEKTQQSLAQEITVGLSAYHLVMIHHRLMQVLTGLSVGFSREMQDIILTQQEQIRLALLTTRTEAEADLLDTQAKLKNLAVSERRQRVMAESLQRITLALTSHINFNMVLDEIFRQARRIVPYDCANIALLDHQHLRVEHHYGYERFGIAAKVASLVQPLTEIPLDAEAIAYKEPLVIADTQQADRWVQLPGSEWIRSYAAVPICLHGVALGLLRFDGMIPDLFTSYHIEYLQPLANAAAIALQNARMYQQVWQEVQTRTAIEQELRLNEARYKNLLQAVPDLLFRVTDKGIIFDFKAASDTDLFTLPEDFLGRNLQQVLPQKLATQLMYYIAIVHNTGQMQIFDYSLSMPDGEHYYEARLVKSADGNILTLVRDVTLRKRAEEQAQRAEQLARLGRLTAALAHEINNPIQALQSNLDLVLDYPLSAQEQKKYLITARQELFRLRKLTHQVLDFARPQAVLRQRIMAADLVQESLTLVESEIHRYNIQVNLNSLADAVVLGSPTQLKGVLNNILINAIEAMETNHIPRRLLITVSRQNQTIAFSFTNTGNLIPEAVLPNVFEPFFTTKPDGHGLGLWLSYNQVLQHHGTITVANIVQLPGVNFTVILPAAL